MDTALNAVYCVLSTDYLKGHDLMPIFSIDVNICATAYVVAATEEEARVKAAAELTDVFVEVPLAREADLPISDADFDAEDFPEISLSPAMTIHGIWKDAEFDMVSE